MMRLVFAVLVFLLPVSGARAAPDMPALMLLTYADALAGRSVLLYAEQGLGAKSWILQWQ